VGTLNYLEPSIAGDVADGIAAWAEDHGVERVSDLVGKLAPAVG
jgi:dihydroorotate dehydrogenase